MNQNYEGSAAELGTEDWSEPFDVVAPTPEIAAEKVLMQWAEDFEGNVGSGLYFGPLQACVREISPGGLPLSDWFYFNGSVKRVYQAIVEAVNTQISGGTSAVSSQFKE